MFIYGKTSANAIAVLSFLAADPARRAGSAEIAEARGIPKPLTAKLLTRLATAGLVQGQPGPGGGYRLAKPATRIRLVDIASLFEQISSPAPCPFGYDCCDRCEPCPLHRRIADIQQASLRLLKETSLSVFASETSACRAEAGAR